MKLLTRELPGPVREHLAERLRGRSITLEDLRKLQTWIQSAPEVPEGDWYRTSAVLNLLDAAAIQKRS